MIVQTYIECENCKAKAYTTERAENLPDGFDHFLCNYCPICEDEMEDYYNEEWVDKNGNIL